METAGNQIGKGHRECASEFKKLPESPLAKGTPREVLEQQSEWYLAKTGKAVTGWIHSGYLELV